MKENKAFFSWINSQTCRELLLRCARTSTQSPSMTQEEIEELATSLWLVIRTSIENPRGNLFFLIVREDWKGLECYLKKKIQFLRDEKNRDKYYQRVRQVLKATEDMGYKSFKDYASFGSILDGVEQIESYAALIQQGFLPTFPSIPVDEVRTGKRIIELADNFRSQLENYFGHEVRIPIRELCSYIREGWPVGTVYEPVTYQNSESEIETMDDVGFDPDTFPDPHPFTHSDTWVAERADCIARQLDDLDLLFLYCLKYYCDMIYKDMAVALGLSGPSGVASRFKKFEHEMRMLLSLEDGLGKEDRDDSLYVRFQDKLLAHCKDEDCSRSTHKEGRSNKEPT